MKLIHHAKINETICPSGGFCRGEECSAFNWFDKYDWKEVEFKWKVPWWAWIRWIKALQMESEAFKEWTPPEIEEWEYRKKWSGIDSKYAMYRKLNKDARWSCGLNVENK